MGLSCGIVCVILRLAILIQYRSVTDRHMMTANTALSIASRGKNHANFFVNRFRGLGVLTSRNFAISIGLASRPYNSVSTAVLHCDGSFDHNHMRSFCGWFEIAYLYTKFDSSNRAVKDSLSHSLDSLWIGGLKFKMGHVTCPFQGRFVLGGLGLATINLCTKFEISRFTHYKDMKGDDQCKKLGGLGG